KAKQAKKKADKKAAKLETLFKKLDANNDGKLDKAEFAKIKEVRQQLRAEKGKVKAADKKKKGEKKAKKGKKGKKSETLFEKLDTDKNGQLSLAEFKKLPEIQKAAREAKKKTKK